MKNLKFRKQYKFNTERGKGLIQISGFEWNRFTTGISFAKNWQSTSHDGWLRPTGEGYYHVTIAFQIPMVTLYVQVPISKTIKRF